MDDAAERIPIDIGYDVAAPAGPAADPRVTVRDDGTMVIDIFAAQPCVPDPATEDEILVCAVAPAQAGEVAPPPPAENPLDRFSDALSFELGGVEFGLVKTRNGTRALGVHATF